MDRIWLSWEKHRRNESLSEEINSLLFQLEIGYSGIKRYVILLLKTISILRKQRPEIIFVQNPSMILAFMVAAYGKMFDKTVVVDAHNIGILFEHKSKPIQYLGQIINKKIFRMASLTIVTNSKLAEYVSENSGTPFVLPDPFPKFINFERVKLKGRKNIFYICSYSMDEPYNEVLEAAKYLDDDVFIYISGRYSKGKIKVEIPDNVILTGYLDEDEFINIMHSVDIVIDLTLREDCLVCGGYEAIAAQKPLILSETNALKQYFSGGAFFCKNETEDIFKAIKCVLNDQKNYEQNVTKYLNKKTEEWTYLKDDLESWLRHHTK